MQSYLPQTPRSILTTTLLLFLFRTNAQRILPTTKSVADSLLRVPIRLVPADHYCKGLGFMCQKEWQLEKASAIPLRLRLGSVEYVDMMEGKARK